MGYMFVMANCATCQQTFTFNPHKVPSIRLRGNREPVCRNCIKRANPVRKKKGLPLIEILPGAYESTEE